MNNMHELPVLDINSLCNEARTFSEFQSIQDEESLYGINDGKTIGTHLEQKFKHYLFHKYQVDTGNSARGIDLPALSVDIKVTSYRQPQSSSPFRDASQKVYGLGYHLLVFVYRKTDNLERQTARLDILNTVFVESNRTADYQTTRGILDIIERDGNIDDIQAYLYEKNLPLDEIGLFNLAERILSQPPVLGYLTISNALQWRLQYSRVIEQAGAVNGLLNLRQQ